MKKISNAKGVLEALLVIGLILIIPLFFVMRTAAEQSPAEKTPVPTQPATENAPTLPATANTPEESKAQKSKQPPACTFPLAETTTEESTPKGYTFSEPQVVLTNKLQPDIIEWLPDNQNVLIMPLELIDLGINGYRQTIELFNPTTKEIKIYATRRKGEDGPPAWNPILNAVVYPYTNLLGEDKTTKKLNIDRQIRISYGNPDDTQLLADKLPQYYVTVKPDGNQMAYLTEKNLVKIDASLNTLKPIQFDRKLQDYKHEFTVIYKMSWRPNSASIFLYNEATDNLGYTYLLNANTGELCNLNFNGWALSARWSPNGRYLAIIRGQNYAPLQFSDLAVLDTATGNLHTLDMPQEIKDSFLVKDIAWAPDNLHLFIVGKSHNYGSNDDFNGKFFIGNFLSGQIDPVLPAYKFKPIWVGTGLAWSSDGSKLLVNCKTSEETSDVCLIFVQASGQ
jgi:hypothetical protein